MKIKFYLSVRSLGSHRPVFASCLEKPESEWLMGFAADKQGRRAVSENRSACSLAVGNGLYFSGPHLYCGLE